MRYQAALRPDLAGAGHFEVPRPKGRHYNSAFRQNNRHAAPLGAGDDDLADRVLPAIAEQVLGRQGNDRRQVLGGCCWVRVRGRALGADFDALEGWGLASFQIAGGTALRLNGAFRTMARGPP